jgi:hypothetical protein
VITIAELWRDDPVTALAAVLYQALARRLCADLDRAEVLPSVASILDRAELAPEYRLRLRAAVESLHFAEQCRRWAASCDGSEIDVKLDGAGYGRWWKP